MKEEKEKKKKYDETDGLKCFLAYNSVIPLGFYFLTRHYDEDVGGWQVTDTCLS